MKEIDNVDGFLAWLSKPKGEVAVRDVPLLDHSLKIKEASFENCLFLGCELEEEAAAHIITTGGVVIPDSKKFRFPVHRARLYHPKELFDGYDPAKINGYQSTFDYLVYDEYVDYGKHNPKRIDVSLYQRLHDHSITDALNEILKGRKVVGIMGGHGMERGSEAYRDTAIISKQLTQAGYLMVSGGGPGAMEATHLGAFFATRSDEDLYEALSILKERPDGAIPGKEYKDADWLQRAWKVLESYPIPEGDEAACLSVGIPTWFYGHEPPAPFATHIAKYFANSIREDGLLMIANHGIVFVPGSAGTTQEIFQDAAQNHYGTSGHACPMILFGVQHWTVNRPLWSFLRQAACGKKYGELLTLTDKVDDVVRAVKSYDPSKYKL